MCSSASRFWFWIGIGLLICGLISLFGVPLPVGAQVRNTPTRDLPPPPRTPPPGERATPTFTPPPETPAPPAAPTPEPTFTPTPEPPETLPPTGVTGTDYWPFVSAVAMIGLGVFIVAWSKKQIDGKRTDG